MTRPTPLPRNAFGHFEDLATRWADNDIYGHMNNVVHYELFDTAVNGFLVREGIIDFGTSPNVFLVVSSGCDYFAELMFPDRITAGLRITRLGGSSVTWEIGLFRNQDPETAALGRFVHVNVDRHTRRPIPITPDHAAILAPLAISPGG